MQWSCLACFTAALIGGRGVEEKKVLDSRRRKKTERGRRRRRSWIGRGENFVLLFATYTTFSELLGVDGRREVQAPGVICHRIFPVDEALGCLADACAYEKRKVIKKVRRVRAAITYLAARV